MAASGEFADKAASALAVFIIIVVPIAGIALFWIVHVLPEKIAEKRHVPERRNSRALPASLVFGGLLWPIAWLWAYSKPVLHKLAYGSDKHEDYYAELEAEAATRRENCRCRRNSVAFGKSSQQLKRWPDPARAMQGFPLPAAQAREPCGRRSHRRGVG